MDVNQCLPRGIASSALVPVLLTGIQQRRVCGAEESFQPKDLSCPDAVTGHRNEALGRSGVTPM
ncbi:hypothetical protein CN191_05625 [Sinorhizobium meliloti]|nr:hypothetical protein CN191_05625 [Sinorhizobium meliloti]